MHGGISRLSERANDIYNRIIDEERKYSAESAIINYYGVKDYMTGHLDDAE